MSNPKQSVIHATNRLVIKVGSSLVTNNVQGLVQHAISNWADQISALKRLGKAVGQMGLVQTYETAFRQHGIKTAQVSLTHKDLSHRTRYLNAISTLHKLLNLNVLPIINENDIVITNEIQFGDNDTLGALVTNLIEADALIILTDLQGLFTADPRKNPEATLIHEAQAGNESLETIAGGAGSEIEVKAVCTSHKRAARSGAATVIA